MFCLRWVPMFLLLFNNLKLFTLYASTTISWPLNCSDCPYSISSVCVRYFYFHFHLWFCFHSYYAVIVVVVVMVFMLNFLFLLCLIVVRLFLFVFVSPIFCTVWAVQNFSNGCIKVNTRMHILLHTHLDKHIHTQQTPAKSLSYTKTGKINYSCFYMSWNRLWVTLFRSLFVSLSLSFSLCYWCCCIGCWLLVACSPVLLLPWITDHGKNCICGKNKINCQIENISSKSYRFRQVSKTNDR